MAHKNQGFTLLELAIVLMVIGLIVAGVVVGKTMIRQGELRDALGEEDRYIKAIKEFQDKYSALPGDMSTATTIWGTDPGGCPYAPYNTVTKTATCNGDGNGLIGKSDVMGYLTASNEWWRAWQHLSNAKLIPQTFTGAQGTQGMTEANIGVNVPASALDTAGWTLFYYMLTCNGDLWSDQYGHLLAFGAYRPFEMTRNPVLLPSEAMVIDQKIDDGKPGTGKVRAWRTGILPSCTTNDTSQTAQSYNAAYSGIACSLVFLLGF